MNELVKEKITVENGSIKIEKIISMDMVRVINAVNYRDETLYTTNSDFFKIINFQELTYIGFEFFNNGETFKRVIYLFFYISL